MVVAGNISKPPYALWSSQPHTWDRYRPMLTRLERISTIHGCSSIRQGLARRLGSFSRL